MMTKKFEFGLEKLLEIRIQKEEESKRNFTRTLREKKETENKLELLKENYAKYSDIKPGESVINQKIKRNYLYVIDKGITETKKDLVINFLEFSLDFRKLLWYCCLLQRRCEYGTNNCRRGLQRRKARRDERGDG